MMVDKVQQLIVIVLNKRLKPEITYLRDAEAEVNPGTLALARTKAVTDNAW